MYQGSLIKLSDIIRFYSTPGDAANKEYRTCYHQALCFYLVAHFLLFTDPEYGDHWIFIIITPFKNDGNMTPIALRKMLNG